jgi:hypothetical protein
VGTGQRNVGRRKKDQDASGWFGKIQQVMGVDSDIQAQGELEIHTGPLQAETAFDSHQQVINDY